MQSACRPSGSACVACRPSSSIDDELARPHVALEAGADEVERAGLGGEHPVVAEPAERERPDAVRVAEADERALGERARPSRRPRAGPSRCATASGSGAGSCAISAAITSVSERRAELDPVRRERVAQLVRVRQVAVVAERDRARAAVVDERLRVRPVRRAGRRVARVADRDVAGERLQVLLVEDLRDEAHVAEHGQAAAVGDGDPGRLLAAVLEREQAEVGRAARRRGSRERMPKTPHIRRSTPPSARRTVEAEQPVAADDAEPPQRHAAEPVDHVRPAREHRLAAALAEPARADRRAARARRRRPEWIAASASATASPPSETSCSERAARRGPPEELDERRLGREVEPRRPPARLAVARLVLGAGERDRRRAGEQDHVALAPRARAPRGRPARARRSRRPASGGSRGRRSRCRARRCRRRSGCRAPRTPRAIPSIASASSQAISGFSGLPKLRQSVSPSGSPPAQATLRAASSTASAPPVRGSSRAIRPWPSSETASPR